MLLVQLDVMPFLRVATERTLESVVHVLRGLTMALSGKSSLSYASLTRRVRKHILQHNTLSVDCLSAPLK